MSPVDRFVEEMGLIFQDQGDPRIAGRIFGLLVIEGCALSLQQISEKLAVSRASVSTNARLLAKRGAIRLTARAGDRQDFYELTTTSYVDILTEMAERVMAQASALQAHVEPIRAENAPASLRVEEISRAFVQSARLLGDWAIAIRNEQTILRDQT